MAKAQITMPDGTNVKIQGTPDEIYTVLERWKGRQQAPKAPRGKPQRVQLVDLIASLIDGGFFKKPKDLAAVKSALEELGHHYPVTTLSPTLLRQVRKRNLRRLKQDNRWMYTQ
jgi:hypothetical protein